MKIKDVMSTPVVTVPPGATVADAARHMDHSGVGSLLVVDAGALVGILTDRDIALRVVGADAPTGTPVREVMTADPITVHPTDDVERAFHAFRHHAVRRLPVVDDRGVVTGMITVDDLLLHSHYVLGSILGPVASELIEPQHPRNGGGPE